jgi:hypothetical protein
MALLDLQGLEVRATEVQGPGMQSIHSQQVSCNRSDLSVTLCAPGCWNSAVSILLCV